MAVLQLVDDVRLAGGREERGQPVVVLDDLVGDDAGRDLPGPAHDQRDAERALPVRVLLAPERGHRAVGPCVHVRPVVGGVHDDRVVGDPEPIEQVEELTDVAVVVEHRVVVGRLPAAGLAEASPLRVGAEVHVRRVHPAEERLAPVVLALDEVAGGVDELVVAGLHPLPGQRARVLDPLLADTSPARVLLRIVLRRRPAAEHAARAEALTELREAVLVRVVGILRVFLGVQVVEVAEELVEAVHRRQELVPVPEVVLAELARRVAVVLQELGDRGVLGLQPDRRAGSPTLLSPVRKTLCPVMNDERPAVQLCSPYASVNRIPSFAMRSMFGVR